MKCRMMHYDAKLSFHKTLQRKDMKYINTPTKQTVSSYRLEKATSKVNEV